MALRARKVSGAFEKRPPGAIIPDYGSWFQLQNPSNVRCLCSCTACSGAWTQLRECMNSDDFPLNLYQCMFINALDLSLLTRLQDIFPKKNPLKPNSIGAPFEA